MNRIQAWATAIKRHEGYYPPSTQYPQGSRSYRNHNPGNFRCSKLMTELGATKCLDNFSYFPDYETGWRALLTFLEYACTDKLRSYRGNMTLYEFYAVYAPSGDGNAPKNYAEAVAKDLGVSPYTRIRELLIDVPEPNPNFPSAFLPLSSWKLTLPIGEPTEVLNLAQYRNPDFFFVRDGGVVFRAPVNGATTSGSKYPRCELREMTNGKLASWSTRDKRSLLFEGAVTAVPEKKKHVVIAQVHDKEDDVLTIRLEYPKLFVDLNGRKGPTLDESYTLGKKFSVLIQSGGGELKVYYNGNPAYTMSKDISGCYFKAGCYTQSNCEKETNCSNANFGETILFKLALDSSPSVKQYHLFGHMDKNFVRKGDRVAKYVTPIGTLGDGNGQYYAHLHFSISEGLSEDELYRYVNGWSKDKVERHYRNPKEVDFQQMFGRKMDVGNFGYGFMQWTGKLYHPGVDVNGLGGGNTDFGYPFKSSCDGVVIHEKRTWFKNGGWGNLIIIESD